MNLSDFDLEANEIVTINLPPGDAAIYGRKFRIIGIEASRIKLEPVIEGAVRAACNPQMEKHRAR